MHSKAEIIITFNIDLFLSSLKIVKNKQKQTET